jgi:hypothetical protein
VQERTELRERLGAGDAERARLGGELEQAQHERTRVEAALATAQQDLHDAQGTCSFNNPAGLPTIFPHITCFCLMMNVAVMHVDASSERERTSSQQVLSKETALEGSARSLKAAEAQLAELRNKCQQVGITLKFGQLIEYLI